MPPVATRKWEYAVIGFILVIASYLLFAPPIVGVADAAIMCVSPHTPESKLR
jgi:hypothetical protein